MTARPTLSQLEVLRTAGALGAVPTSQGDGSVLMEYPYAQDTQMTDLVLSVNPDTGTDPISPIRITTQAQADAYGDFATVKGAAETIPPAIGSNIIFQIADGTYNISGNDFFDGLNRLRPARLFNLGGIGDPVINQITVKSASGVVKISGTATSQVISHIDEWDITLASDPGYTPNQYRGKYLMIVSGTGLGQYRTISTHSGVSVKLSGPFDAIDNTSQVEIYETAGFLNFTQPQAIYGCPSGADGDGVLVLEGLSLINTSTPMLSLFDGSIKFEGCYTNCRVYLHGVLLNVENFVINGGNSISFGISMGGSIRGGPGLLIHDCTTAGIFFDGSYHNTSALIFRGSIESCPRALYLNFASKLQIYSWMNTVGCDYGLSIRGGSAVIADMSYQIGRTRQLSGDIADIELGDGIGTLDWEDLDSLGDKTAIAGPNSVTGF